jgi:hypothetical protein
MNPELAFCAVAAFWQDSLAALTTAVIWARFKRPALLRRGKHFERLFDSVRAAVRFSLLLTASIPKMN